MQEENNETTAHVISAQLQRWPDNFRRIRLSDLDPQWIWTQSESDSH